MKYAIVRSGSGDNMGPLNMAIGYITCPTSMKDEKNNLKKNYG